MINLRNHKWRWAPDEQGTFTFNVLGALECTLCNLGLIYPLHNSWEVDDMERFSFKFRILKRGDNDIYSN